MILEATGGRGVAGDLEKTFEGLETDSRQIGPRFIFWALRGERFDGHDFVAVAAERGASGAVVTPGRFGASDFAEDFTLIEVPDTLKALGDLAAWWRSRHKPFVVAVTGSAGKTTTKEMIAEILALSAPTLKTEGNFNNLIGLPLTLLRLRPETERVVLERPAPRGPHHQCGEGPPGGGGRSGGGGEGQDGVDPGNARRWAGGSQRGRCGGWFSTGTMLCCCARPDPFVRTP
ncbi:MAG: hypothetical protein JRH05_15320 [Deltaproteobacteria bacterium]|nr:hypothetical protein [Deltaproteobacteria bacterium]